MMVVVAKRVAVVVSTTTWPRSFDFDHHRRILDVSQRKPGLTGSLVDGKWREKETGRGKWFTEWLEAVERCATTILSNVVFLAESGLLHYNQAKAS